MKNSASNQIIAFEGVRVFTETSSPFDTVMDRLRAATGSTSVPEVVELAGKVASPDEYISEVERRFVGPSGFMIFAENDHGSWIKVFGIHRRTVRVILGNPLIAITMLKHDLATGLFVPPMLLVTEKEGGSGTEVLYVRPSSLIAVGEVDAELESAAQRLDEKMAALVTNITAG